MTRHDISALRVGEEVIDFYMVRAIAIKMGANGKYYCDLLLGDASGDINAKKWDVNSEEESMLNAIQEGDIVKIQGKVKDFNNQLQLTVTQIRKTREGDMFDIKTLVKAAPEDPNAMYEYIFSRADSMKDLDLKKICISLLESNREKLLYYPAAQRNHHAEMAGLLYHVKRMLMSGEKICEVYTGLNRDLVITGVIIHDIEKLREIESNCYGVSPGYSFEGQLLGHIVQGVMAIEKLCAEFGVSREKTVMLEHMVLTHHYEPEFGSPKKPMFPEAELLHYLDMIDAKLFDMEDALSATDPGDFSGRVWTLENRRIYKPEDWEDQND